VVAELEKRDDIEPKVHYRPTPDGHFAFAIEDVSFNPVVAKETQR